MGSFIDEKDIEGILAQNIHPSADCVREIIKKAKGLKGLTPEETAVLLQCEDKKSVEDIFEAAKFIKEHIYGNRLVLFAPLYLTNHCVNNCIYCGFRAENKDLIRKRLDFDEIKKEVEVLEGEGHKRLLLVGGEDPKTANIEYLEEAIKAVYEVKNGAGAIRRVNVNVAPLSVEDFKRLKQSGIGTYQLFQETYHRKTYEKMHPSGPKADFEWRLFGPDRAFKAGIDDLGIGVLFGLYDYKFEVLALLQHCLYLEKEFSVGPHTISIPRVKPALNAPLSDNIPHRVCDDDFKKIVAIIRLAVPYTGMILSTREDAHFRDEVFALGISQISAGSRSSPGAYIENKEHAPREEQFHLEDTRTQLDIVKDIIKQGFLPSFCTACYRLGRTGKNFMDLAKPGEIKNFCIPNCILTFKEYTLDYADAALKNEAVEVISRELHKISDNLVREKTIEKLMLLESGVRDLYF